MTGSDGAPSADASPGVTSEDVAAGAFHDVEDAVDAGCGEIPAGRIAHRVHEDRAPALPVERLVELPGAELEVEAAFAGVGKGAAEALGAAVAGTGIDPGESGPGFRTATVRAVRERPAMGGRRAGRRSRRRRLPGESAGRLGGVTGNPPASSVRRAPCAKRRPVIPESHVTRSPKWSPPTGVGRFGPRQ